MFKVTFRSQLFPGYGYPWKNGKKGIVFCLLSKTKYCRRRMFSSWRKILTCTKNPKKPINKTKALKSNKKSFADFWWNSDKGVLGYGVLIFSTKTWISWLQRKGCGESKMIQMGRDQIWDWELYSLSRLG